jgi:hypothetical protein
MVVKMTDPTWPEPTTSYGGIRPHRPMTPAEAEQAREVALSTTIALAALGIDKHDQFIEELMSNMSESWGSTEGSAESIVVDYVRELEARVQALGGSLERHADAPVPWRWLSSTRDLQRVAYGDDDYPKSGEALADSVMMNHTALVVELGEAMKEVGWKPWITENRGWVNRDAYVKELVDVGHFLANLLVAVGVTDGEWEALYRAKQEINLQRQEVGYDGLAGKCHVCKRALDDGGTERRENPRRPGTFQLVCAGCGAIVSSAAYVKSFVNQDARERAIRGGADPRDVLDES